MGAYTHLWNNMSVADYGYYGIPWVLIGVCARLWGFMGLYENL